MPTLRSAKKSDLPPNQQGESTTSPSDSQRPSTTDNNVDTTEQDVTHPSEGEEVVNPPLQMAELTLEDLEDADVGETNVGVPEVETVHSGTQASITQAHSGTQASVRNTHSGTQASIQTHNIPLTQTATGEPVRKDDSKPSSRAHSADEIRTASYPKGTNKGPGPTKVVSSEHLRGLNVPVPKQSSHSVHSNLTEVDISRSPRSWKTRFRSRPNKTRAFSEKPSMAFSKLTPKATEDQAAVSARELASKPWHSQGYASAGHRKWIDHNGDRYPSQALPRMSSSQELSTINPTTILGMMTALVPKLVFRHRV